MTMPDFETPTPAPAAPKKPRRRPTKKIVKKAVKAPKRSRRTRQKRSARSTKPIMNVSVSRLLALMDASEYVATILASLSRAERDIVLRSPRIAKLLS